MLDPSMPWLTPGYRKILSQGTFSLSASLSSTPTDDFHLMHSTATSRQQRRVRSAIVSSRHRLQPTPPVTPELLLPHDAPQSALLTCYRRDHYVVEQPGSALQRQRPKSALQRSNQNGLRAPEHITQYRIPRRVKSARHLRHRPTLLQNKSITQVERLHQARLMVSSIPVGQTADHKLCAYCPVECRPRSCSSHRPTSSTGLIAAGVPSHFDRAKFWSNGAARPRTAPTLIQRGTVPHYTHFISGLSLYPRDGSPLPAPQETGPTIIVQEDVDHSLSSEFGDTDTVGFSASVLNDSDWEDVDEEYSDYREDILFDGAVDVTESTDGSAGCSRQPPDIEASSSMTEAPPNAMGESSVVPEENEIKEESLPPTLSTSPVAGEEEALPTTHNDDCGLKGDGDDNEDLQQDLARVDSVKTSQSPENMIQDSSELMPNEDASKIPDETEDLGRKSEETLVVDDREADYKVDVVEEETELKPVVKMIPTPAERTGAGRFHRKEPLSSSKDERPPIPNIRLTVGEDALDKNDEGSSGMTTQSISGSEAGIRPEDKTGPPLVKLGPRPPKMKVNFMSVDADTMKEILDTEMKLRRREAEEKSSEAGEEEDSNQDNKKVFVPSSWNCCRVALSRQAGRFEMPMDTRDLIGLTPVEYLKKYCRVSSQRRALYRRTFSRVDRDKDGKLKRKEIECAVTEALVDTVGGEQVADVLRSIGADNHNLMMTFELFAPFCALLERLYYSQFVTEDSSDRDACLKDRIEDADFSALEWKLDGHDISDDLRRLLQGL